MRSKLVTLVLASVGISVALIATATSWRDANRDAALQSERLVSSTAILASVTSAAAAANDPARAYAAIRAVARMPGVEYARVENASGALLAETGSGVRLSTDATIDAGRTPGLLSLMSSRTVETSAPVLAGRQRVGRVVVLGRLEGEGGRVAQSLAISLAAAALAAVAGLLVAWRLQRGISRPIVALTRAVNEIRTSHDYASRADIPADDEVADLVSGFNDMLGEISRRDDAIARHLEGLEQTVAERTADLKLAKDAAEAATNAKSDFLATMSHEIRTPMNGVMVMAEMLVGSELPPKQRRFAELIARSGSSLLAIINDILDLSKIEAGKLTLEAAPVDIGDIAEDVCGLFWERAREKRLDLAAFVDPATPQAILADEVRLRQIVGNLVNNAIKFTETGGVVVRIEPVGAARLRIVVRDTGIGIAPDKLDAVFGAFSQADQSTTRKFGGTGLGLAICKRLVEAMDGRISVASAPGKGSAFTVEMPIAVAAAAEPWPQLGFDRAAVALDGVATGYALGRYLASAGLELTAFEPARTSGAGLLFADPGHLAQSIGDLEAVCLGEYGDSAPQQLLRDGKAKAVLVQPFRRRELAALLGQRARGEPLSAFRVEEAAAATTLPQFEGARVLVADDSAVNREVAIEALSRLGVTPTVAVDGRQAVARAADQRFDLILMDGSMPEMDGYDAARAIRARETASAAPRTPIIALTAHMIGAAADEWRSADMDGVLHKPFTLAALAKALAEHITPTGELAAPAAAPAGRAPASAAGDLLDGGVVAELEAMAAGGRGAFVERVRGLYRANAPDIVAAIEHARDAAEVARAAHALKSMSFNIGARAVAELTGQIELAARAKGELDVEAIGRVRAVVDATLAALGDPAPAEAVAAIERAAAEREEDALLDDLRTAPQRGELSLVYQPQVSRDGMVAGCEALARWTHPVRGPISPGIFIPLAERRGAVTPLTFWALDQAMADTADLGSLPVAVNASALDFNEPGFVDRLAGLIDRRGFDPGRLEIEITETAILKGVDEARRNIERLHALGVKIALDDFGVGYSSLSHLRLFDFDKLKIDKLFIDSCNGDVGAAAVVHGVIGIGRALGMKIVAEGVETEDQRQFLKIAGVHALQGYLLARPMPIEALRDWLARERSATAAA